jgi:hypothetical protein
MRSHQHPLHYLAVLDSGQAEIEAGVAVGEAFVIKGAMGSNLDS